MLARTITPHSHCRTLPPYGGCSEWFTLLPDQELRTEMPCQVIQPCTVWEAGGGGGTHLRASRWLWVPSTCRCCKPDQSQVFTCSSLSIYIHPNTSNGFKCKADIALICFAEWVWGRAYSLPPKAGQSLPVSGIPEGHSAGFMLGKNKLKAEELVYQTVPGLTPNWSWPESSGPTWHCSNSSLAS